MVEKQSIRNLEKQERSQDDQKRWYNFNLNWESKWKKLNTRKKVIVVMKYFTFIDLLFMGLEITRTDFAKTLFFNIVSYTIQFLFVVECIVIGSIEKENYWKNKWDMLNLMVTVVTTIPITIWTKYSDAIRALRVLRAFRLFYHFHGFKALIRIVLRSIREVSWSGLLLFVFLYCYAVEGTFLFGDSFEMYFGTVWKSLFTLFQIMTFESWAVDIARPIMEIYPASWIYFISFTVVTCLVIMNVVQGYIVNTILQHSYLIKNSDEEELEHLYKVRKHLAEAETSIDGLLKENQNDSVDYEDNSNCKTPNTKKSNENDKSSSG